MGKENPEVAACFLSEIAGSKTNSSCSGLGRYRTAKAAVQTLSKLVIPAVVVRRR